MVTQCTIIEKINFINVGKNIIRKIVLNNCYILVDNLNTLYYIVHVTFFRRKFIMINLVFIIINY